MDVTTLSLKMEQLSINPEEISKLMGYSEEVPEQISEIITSELALLKDVKGIKGAYTMAAPTFSKEDYSVLLNKHHFKVGKAVWQFLKEAEEIALFICTAGNTISDRSKTLMNRGDILEGYVVDVIGSVVVEKAMDLIHEKIKLEALEKGMTCTNRYSPGYCDWDVAEQKMLFANFPDNCCHITLSDTCLMAPIKSVSGFIGLGKEVKYQQYVCDTCNSQNCLYRKTKHQ